VVEQTLLPDVAWGASAPPFGTGVKGKWLIFPLTSIFSAALNRATLWKWLRAHQHIELHWHPRD
jgi:hypothetical protein